MNAARIYGPVALRDSSRSFRRSVATVLAVLCLPTACDSPKKPTSSEAPAVSPPASSAHLDEPVVVPIARDGAASMFVSEAAAYARRPLGFTNPRLSFVLLGCSDTSGHLDPQSAACPGGMVATFEEDPRSNEVAFVSLGKAGIAGQRRSRASVISLPPARCTVERFFGAAKQAGVQWSVASDVFVGYGPIAIGFATPSGAAWTVKRGDAVLFSLADSSCATVPP
jgi:hypothetical protein